MTKLLDRAKSILFGTFMIFTCVWIFFALSFQLFAVYLELTNQDERMLEISNEISWRIDGTFKDNPKNIWYKK